MFAQTQFNSFSEKREVLFGNIFVRINASIFQLLTCKQKAIAVNCFQKIESGVGNMGRICRTLAAYRQIVNGAGISRMEETASKEKMLGIVQLFEGVNDVRCSGMIRYPLSEILVICFLSVLSNADTWVEIANFGKAKEAWLKTFDLCGETARKACAQDELVS